MSQPDFGRLLESGGAWQGPLWEEVRDGLLEAGVLREGESVGRYRVLREIGRGGMSVVYLAERTDAFRRQVALKVLDGAPRDREARARFEQERQILATLDHPNIARLLDGGVDGQGRPYIVMELVEGQPIDRYCAERRLPVEERLALFQVVARAVAHAHRRLVVHRDLKPSNILVTGSGEVKLLDFGIAKLLDPGVAGPWAAPPTRTALRLLTPEYATPEQVRGEPVTTASDVYQLGLVLYEMLTGRRAHALGDGSLLALERTVCAGEPARPSSLVHGRRLAGDIDSIVLMALRKEPERRYPSPADLAADLDRHLSGLPVLAREDGLLYRAGKLLRRHRLGVTAAALVVLSLVGGFGAAVWQATAATREAKRATEVQDFLVRIFEIADPDEARGRTVTARELLDQGVRRIEALQDQPQVQAALLQAAGISYRNLGLYDAARPLLERSLALRRRLHGERSLEAAEGEHQLGVLLDHQAEAARAVALHRRALATRRARLSADDPLVIDSLFALASAHVGNHEEVERLLNEALALRRQRSGPGHPQEGEILNDLGILRHRQGDYEAAERLYRQGLAIQRKAWGEVHPEVAVSIHNLGAILLRRERPAEAEALFREALAIETRLYEPDHPALADTWGYLGHARRALGDLQAAEPAYRRSLEINLARRGATHPSTVSAKRNLGRLLVETGRPREAEPLLREAVAWYEERGDEARARETREVLEKSLAAPVDSPPVRSS